MDDLRRRFARLDQVQVPDLWDAIELRATAIGSVERVTPVVTPVPRTSAPSTGRSPMVYLAAVAVILALLAGAIAVGAGLVRLPAIVPVKLSTAPSVTSLPSAPVVPAADAGRLAFIRLGDLFVADANGTNARLVAHVDGSDLGSPHWSPDGRRIAVGTPEPAILLVDPRSGDVRRLAAGTIGGWSPDSRSLAYFTADEEIAVVDVEGGASRVLVARQEGGNGYVSGWGDPLSWSPDGRWLIDDSQNHGGQMSLIRIDAANGDIVVLHTTADFYQYQADWSPDSSQVAFAVVQDLRSSSTLWVASVDGDGTTEIRGPDHGVFSPRWSPDGEWIAFISSPGWKPPGRLMIVRPDGSGARPLAEDAQGIVGWSPDGESIGYTVAVPDEAGPDRHVLHVVSIANGADRGLPLPPNAGDFQWTATAAETGEPSPPPAVAAPSPTDPIGEPGAGEPLQPDATWGGIAFRTAEQGDFDCYVGVLRFPFDSSVVSPGARPTIPGGSAGDGPTPGPQKAASCDLTFAPDGSAFIRADQLSSTWEIVRFDGSVVAGPSPYSPAPPAWSTGGDWLVMPACDADDCSHAIIERPDGSGRRELPGQPWWSAGDEFLSVQGPGGSLLVGNGDGTDLHPIGSFPQPGGWSPDGSSFVFVRDGDAWIAGANGTGTRNLTAFPLGGASDAAWSPDGSWILVLQGSTVWAVTPDGSGRHRLGADLGPPNPDEPWAPAWSPAGASVAIGAGEGTVLFSTGDWHGVRVLHAWQPVWSPDGRFVAVVSDVGDAYTVDVMRPDGSSRTTVSAAISYPPVIWLP